MKNVTHKDFNRIGPDNEDMSAAYLVNFCLEYLRRDDGHELHERLTSHSKERPLSFTGDECLKMITYEELIGTLNVVKRTLAEMEKNQLPVPAVIKESQFDPEYGHTPARSAEINAIQAGLNVEFYEKQLQSAKRRQALARKLSVSLGNDPDDDCFKFQSE